MSEEAAVEGPRPFPYLRRELPGTPWLTCHGCPALRVYDWHYFYCRRLGDQRKPDAWNAGWARLWHGTTWEADAVCALPAVALPTPPQEQP